MAHDSELDSGATDKQSEGAAHHPGPEHEPTGMLANAAAHVGAAAMQRKIQKRKAARTNKPAAHAVPGGALNVDLTHLNNHPGMDANRLGGADKKPFKTIASGRLYQDDGEPIGELQIPSGVAVNINAGAVCDLVLHDPENPKATQAHKCVYVFDYDKTSGWMPASCLPKAALSDDQAVEGRIDKQRGDAHRKFGKGVPIRSGVSADSDGVGALYTYPNQTTAQNMAKYYYGGLALNVPFTGGARVGVIDAAIPPAPEPLKSLDPYREFYPVEPAQVVSIPLYAKGKSKPSGKQLHFQYGYVNSDAGDKLHGWINTSLITEGANGGGGADGGGAVASAEPSLAAIDKQFHLQHGDQLEEEKGAKKQATAWSYGETLAAAVEVKDPSVSTLIKGLGQYQLHESKDPKGSQAFAPDAHNQEVRFYDDNSWIGLDLMRQWELRHDPNLLAEAGRIFEFIQVGQQNQKANKKTGQKAGDHGVKWDEDPSSTSENVASTAPAAELAMRLYLAVQDKDPAKAARYLQFAKSAESFLKKKLEFQSGPQKGLYKDHEGQDSRQHLSPDAVFAYNEGTPVGLDLMLYQATQKSDAAAANGYFQSARTTATVSLAQLDPKRLLHQEPVFVAVYYRNLLMFSHIGHNDPNYAAAHAIVQSAAASLATYVELVQKSFDPKDGLFDKDDFSGDSKSKRPTLLSQTALVEVFALQKEFAAAISA